MKHFYIHLHHNLVLHINFTLQTTENGCNLRTEKETAFSGHTFDPPVMGVFFFFLALYKRSPSLCVLLTHLRFGGSVGLEKTLVSPLDRKEIKAVNSKGNQTLIFIGGPFSESPILWSPNVKS